MAYVNDQDRQGRQDDPEQWDQDDESFDDDLSAQPGRGYGLAGQGPMGDAMARDVDLDEEPDVAPGEQDPYHRRGGTQGKPDRAQQQDDLWGQDPYQQGDLDDLDDLDQP
jgi:hypothetical protein